MRLGDDKDVEVEGGDEWSKDFGDIGVTGEGYDGGFETE